VGPSDEADDATINVGVAAHIAAAAKGPGARRYDPNMTPEQRSSIDNGIWLCQTCAKRIDSDDESFATEALKKMKADAESRAKERLGVADSSQKRMPSLALRWLNGEEGTECLRIARCPRRLWRLDAAYFPWPISKGSDEQEKAVLERFNTDVATALEDPLRHEQWREHCQKKRFDEFGKRCGLVLACDRAPANGIRCTLNFPEGFEVYEADDPPAPKPAPAMPELPLVGFEKRFQRMDRLFEVSRLVKGLALPTAGSGRRLRTRFALPGPRLSVEGGEITVSAAHLGPRRSRPFKDDSGLVIVAPSETGEYSVPWTADCEELDAPLTGELKVLVQFEDRMAEPASRESSDSGSEC
jgi:hypothetical protein